MENYISIKKLAQFHNISEKTLQEFADYGIFEIHIIQNEPCIQPDKLSRYERAIRLYRDLGVNKEGIEIIMEMRDKLENLQKEVNKLHRQLYKFDNRLHKPFIENFYDIEL